MSKIMASFLVFIDTIGVAIALLGGNMMLCLLMGIMTIILYASIVKLSATLMAYSYNWSRKLNQLWHNIRWTTIA